MKCFTKFKHISPVLNETPSDLISLEYRENRYLSILLNVINTINCAGLNVDVDELNNNT